MKNFPKVILAGSLATTATSEPLSLDQMYGYCIQDTVSGALIAGSYQIQGSCDMGQPDGTLITNWFPVGSAVTFTTAKTTGTNFDAVYYRWVRIVFTANSGTGTYSITISPKGA